MKLLQVNQKHVDEPCDICEKLVTIEGKYDKEFGFYYCKKCAEIIEEKEDD